VKTANVEKFFIIQQRKIALVGVWVEVRESTDHLLETSRLVHIADERHFHSPAMLDCEWRTIQLVWSSKGEQS
jgi:hypothetical protein